MKKNNKVIDAYLKIINEGYSMAGPDMSDINVSVNGNAELNNAQNAEDEDDKILKQAEEIKARNAKEDARKAAAKAKRDAKKAEAESIAKKYNDISENFKNTYKIVAKYYVPSDDKFEVADFQTFEDINELKGYYIRKYNKSFEAYDARLRKAVKEEFRDIPRWLS